MTLDMQLIENLSNDYNELISGIEIQVQEWSAQLEKADGTEKEQLQLKLKMLQDNRKSIEEAYSIYMDAHDENWATIVENSSTAYKETLRFEGFA